MRVYKLSDLVKWPQHRIVRIYKENGAEVTATQWNEALDEANKKIIVDKEKFIKMLIHDFHVSKIKAEYIGQYFSTNLKSIIKEIGEIEWK